MRMAASRVLIMFLLTAVSYITAVSLYSSCLNRCGQVLDPSLPCQCNSHCQRYGDCCADYSSVCLSSNATLPSSEISDAELMAFGDVLWLADENRFFQQEITLNTNNPSQRLFVQVNEAKLQANPSFRLFIALLDNYNPLVGQPEPAATQAELNEQNEFLTYIRGTPVMQELLYFLARKGKVTTSEEFVTLLKGMWFSYYPRSSSTRTADSSGFEHVFVGEKKSTSITGFHSWVQMYLLEKSGRLDYQGYNSMAEPNLMDIRLSWDNLLKDRASMFIGTSPEFEMALYTLCFVAKPGGVCRTTIQGHPVSIQTYDVSHASGLQVATAYPMIN